MHLLWMCESIKGVFCFSVHFGKIKCQWCIQAGGGRALSVGYAALHFGRCVCCQGQRRTACLNVTPVWTAKISILRVSKLELAVMQCHYSTKAGHGCRGTVQNGTVCELKSFFYLSGVNAICRKCWYNVLSLTFSARERHTERERGREETERQILWKGQQIKLFFYRTSTEDLRHNMLGLHCGWKLTYYKQIRLGHD